MLGVSCTVVVLTVSFLTILFMFTGENGLVCYFCPDGGIWESGTIMESLMTATVGVGEAPSKTATSAVASLVR